jgi:hypothetical protein
MWERLAHLLDLLRRAHSMEVEHWPIVHPNPPSLEGCWHAIFRSLKAKPLYPHVRDCDGVHVYLEAINTVHVCYTSRD